MRLDPIPFHEPNVARAVFLPDSFQQRTANLLSVQNLFARNRGQTPNGNAVKRMDDKTVEWLMEDECRALAVKRNLAIMQALEAQIKRNYQRKRAKTSGIVAIKTVAHKLSRACYYILRDQVPFDVEKAFG